MFILHANACGTGGAQGGLRSMADGPMADGSMADGSMADGSHGRSRVVGPTGVILAEGGIDTEETVSATL